MTLRRVNGLGGEVSEFLRGRGAIVRRGDSQRGGLIFSSWTFIYKFQNLAIEILFRIWKKMSWG